MKNTLFIASCALLTVLLFVMGAKAEPSMASPETPDPMTIAQGMNYCRTLISVCDLKSDGSACGGDQYAGWWLPTAEELSHFVGLSTSQNYNWSRTPFTQELDTYIIMSLLDGSWGYGGYGNAAVVRCVR
ncbi:DUF1566 domain-containing protein [Bdellovibrio bacteriovorus]|uniref:DUF1566 domain-containing protein n=1 Tax=Bdellovibrio bacteriovorus str. Tiberius TaxID=1069642 RepID=K7ZGL4_BDEBC|nr:DUF1566 domain-containing protein [Bdellovibrio bacteriovorus]AFY02622.1 Hypothetical protein Bdt_2947 [Bdellovibrio bacteriovorus str. Tiberius]